MLRHYLFGPVTRSFAEQNLLEERQAGHCVAFDPEGSTDLAIGPGETWEAVCARLPDGWRPDFVVLYLPYTSIPACLWTAPVPLIGLAADWNLLWSYYRQRLPLCDLVLTDTAGVEALTREGIQHARAANLFGCERAFLEYPYPERERDIDILFVGNVHPAVHRERLAWLGRLARFGERWRVAIHSGVFGDAYRDLLGRARIVFNRGIRGECNRRVFEAAAAGALLFQEAENREVPAYFQDGAECVCYTDDNLESLLEEYLTHEDRRQVLAEAARRKVREYSFEKLWQGHLALIEAEWPALLDLARCRVPPSEPFDVLTRCWQALSSGGAGDPALVSDLEAASVSKAHSSRLANALGVVTALTGQGRGGLPPAMLEKARSCFTQTLAINPLHAVAGLNLVEALNSAGQRETAVQQARRLLTLLGRLPRLDWSLLDAPHFPPGFDCFRVEWEKAGWEHAGEPAAEARAKHALLRWRLHTLLAELTGDVAHHYEAWRAQPDLPPARRALGLALARAGHPTEAVAYLRPAVAANPFDGDAARTLHAALGASGDELGQRALVEERRLLAQAAPTLVPAEPWFDNPPPAADELATLVILCCNQVEYTRQCLESVFQHTRRPYELVLIDNGSTDETPAYLEEVCSRPEPSRVRILRNASNRGFPAGCNQGLAEAQGRYLVFLNNDTVVTESWLDGLIAWARHDWPNVGLVGAVTNASRPPQQISVEYQRLEELPAFAARRGQAYAGKAMAVERLAGFCLLARRDVLDKIGGFDEQYGLGFFDDDDLCVRAGQAGFQLLVALNVFIHHFGSRTFTGLGVDCRQHLHDNFDRFKSKWGLEHAAGYHLPDRVARPEVLRRAWQLATTPFGVPQGVPPQTASVSRRDAVTCPRVSLCVIARNEEANLPACLASVADLVGETVVVDTGSTDRTKEIALAAGARVFDFPWVDSFAAARNESLRHATGDWIFWMDADDRLDEDNRQRLRALFAGLKEENVAHVMKCLCLPDPATGAATVVDHVRLFRNHPEIRWRYRVHEQILPAVRRLGGEVRWSDVAIQHAGYQDAALRRRKLDRDLRLLNLENAEQPDDPFTLFNLGSVYQELGRIAEAVPLLRRSLERSQPADSIVRKLYALLIQCHRQLSQPAEALALCEAGRQHYPQDAELLFQEGLVLREQGNFAGAESVLLQLLQTQEGAHFASVDTGLRGYKARHNLAVIYHEHGRPVEAEAQWRAAVTEQPGFTPGWLGLGEVYLGQQRWADLEAVAMHLTAAPQTAVEGAVVRARGQLARREFPAARQTLAKVIVDAPQALWPRVILTHVLLQEGRDWAAAERALRDVLDIAPNHAEARRNLSVLLHQQGRALAS